MVQRRNSAASSWSGAGDPPYVAQTRNEEVRVEGIWQEVA